MIDPINRLQPSAFTAEENIVNRIYSQFTAVSPGMYHTFFVVEGKGSGGSLEAAENQSCRAGAAAVNAMKQLISLNNDIVIADGAIANSTAADDVDKQSIVFSLSMVPVICRDVSALGRGDTGGDLVSYGVDCALLVEGRGADQEAPTRH